MVHCALKIRVSCASVPGLHQQAGTVFGGDTCGSVRLSVVGSICPPKWFD